MKIAVLGGTGRQGKGLAMRFALIGHDVWVGSRTEEKAKDAVTAMNEQLGTPVSLHAADNALAARQADIVFLTVPHPHEVPTVENLKASLLGKILVDVSVPLTHYKPPEAELPAPGSSAEAVQAVLGEQTSVVAAFKTTSSALLQRVEKSLISDEWVCGNNSDANKKVMALIEALGGRAVDAGALRNARAMESMTAVLIGLEQRYKKRDVGFQFVGL